MVCWPPPLAIIRSRPRRSRSWARPRRLPLATLLLQNRESSRCTRKSSQSRAVASPSPTASTDDLGPLQFRPRDAGGAQPNA